MCYICVCLCMFGCFVDWLKCVFVGFNYSAEIQLERRARSRTPEEMWILGVVGCSRSACVQVCVCYCRCVFELRCVCPMRCQLGFVPDGCQIRGVGTSGLSGGTVIGITLLQTKALTLSMIIYYGYSNKQFYIAYIYG